jgi:hypothetical protein
MTCCARPFLPDVLMLYPSEANLRLHATTLAAAACRASQIASD